MRVSVRQQLSTALLATGIPFKGRGDSERFAKELAQIMPQVAGVRRFGSAALDPADVAAGRYDGFWEAGLSPWDIAAGILLVREAGGFVSEFNGRSNMLETGDVVAANDKLHRNLLKALKLPA
ncbi:MAG: inositol monophosphatase, partial [Sphingomonadales bacterium]|nr:inositol monophosphatase [Sphingomonadales bacterium]